MAKVKRMKRSYHRLVYLGIALLVIIAGVVFFLKKEPPKKTNDPNMFVTQSDDAKEILLMGIDPRRGDLGRTDTLLLASIDLKKERAAVMSIPRDTRVELEVNGQKNNFDKINHAYTFGNVDLTQKTVSNLLSVYLDGYVLVDCKAMIRVFDALEGIDIFIEKDMHYEDPWDDDGGLVIDLKKGQQHLDGEHAMQYLRFRDETGDIGRIQRQQKFLQAILNKITSPNIISKLPKILEELKPAIRTNMTTTELLTILNTLPAIKKNELPIITMAGTPGFWNNTSYWVPDIVSARRDLANQMQVTFSPSMIEVAEKTAQRYQNSLPSGITSIEGTLRIASEGAAQSKENSNSKANSNSKEKNSQAQTTTQAASHKKEELSIYIYNETLIDGAGARAAEELKKRGFKVAHVGNTDKHNRSQSAFLVPPSDVNLFYGLPFPCVIIPSDDKFTKEVYLWIGEDFQK